MSHNIQHFTYSYGVDKRKVEDRLNEFVAQEDWQEGCCGLYNPIRWIDKKIYDSEDDATKAVESLDRGCYDNLAVPFYFVRSVEDRKVNELRDKAKDAYSEYKKRDEHLYSKTLTSTFIGCKQCGSKLAREYLTRNECPVCYADLRSETIKKSIESAKQKWNRANKAVKEYQSSHGKREIMWLVKIEYHT